MVDLGSAAVPRLILEPGYGGGSFLRACRACWGNAPTLVGVDLKRRATGVDSGLLELHHSDFLAEGFGPHGGELDLVIGNPPFALAEEFVAKGLGLLREGGLLAFLLRANFICGGRGREGGCFRDTRGKEFTAIAGARPSFGMGCDTDGAEYVLVRITKGSTEPGRWSAPIDWERAK